MLSRAALDKIGGFYTESITEDFATGILIESSGFVSLGLGEPLASGQTPHTYKERIQQRTRWGRGVIVTARKLKLMKRKGLTPGQKISYWSSVVYWYSPIKNLYYLILSLFLVDGRDSDTEPVKVMDAVPVSVTDKSGNREYEGVTTLPQSLHHDFGILTHLWQNIAHRIARTAK